MACSCLSPFCHRHRMSGVLSCKLFASCNLRTEVSKIHTPLFFLMDHHSEAEGSSKTKFSAVSDSQRVSLHRVRLCTGSANFWIKRHSPVVKLIVQVRSSLDGERCMLRPRRMIRKGYMEDGRVHACTMKAESRRRPAGESWCSPARYDCFCTIMSFKEIRSRTLTLMYHVTCASQSDNNNNFCRSTRRP